MKKRWMGICFAMFSALGFAQQSLSIEEALQYAVDHNVQVEKARLDRLIADQKVKETTGIGLPQLSAQGKYNYFLEIPVQLLPAEIAGGPKGEFIPVRFGQKQNASGGITLTQLLFNGSYIVGLQSAKAYKETAALAEEKTQISVREAILMAYAGVLVTDENIATLEKNRSVVEKTFHDLKEIYRVGLTELQNVEQMEYSYKSLVANQQNLVRTREKLLMTLKYLLNFPAEEPLTLTTSMDELVRKNEALIDMNGKFDIDGHIDYRLRQNALKLSELQLKLQKSKALPTLAAAVNSTYNGYANEFNFFKKSQPWFNTSVIALQLDIPIFSGLQRHYQTEQAKIQVEKAKLDLEDTARMLRNNAYSSAIDFENAYNMYKNAQDLIALSESIYKKMQIKYKEGMATSTELQTVETQLYDAQRKYYEAAIGLVRAKTSYDTATGNLGGNYTPSSQINGSIQSTTASQAETTQQRVQTDVNTRTSQQPLLQSPSQTSPQTSPATPK